MLGFPEAEMAIDWNYGCVQYADHQGNLRAAKCTKPWYKMTVMLQSGLDISPVIRIILTRTIFKRVRCHAERPKWQGCVALGGLRRTTHCKLFYEQSFFELYKKQQVLLFLSGIVIGFQKKCDVLFHDAALVLVVLSCARVVSPSVALGVYSH